MTLSAAYIIESAKERDPHEFVPEESRRARAVPVYAALRNMGRHGVRRDCRFALRMCMPSDAEQMADSAPRPDG